MLVGLLAVLKIGAAYVPQDARIVPPLQLAMVLETLTAPVILTLSNLQARVPEAQAQRCLCLDAFLAEELGGRGQRSGVDRSRPGRPVFCVVHPAPLGGPMACVSAIATCATFY
jgi:non-ribosomal peptide synthetase component F